MTEEKKASTPLLDELEDGPWPSFVKEMKKEAHRPMTRDALLQLERSYEEHLSHWKHGGLVGVMGYGGGVIGRYSDLADEFPAVADFHTHRVNQPWPGSTPATPSAPSATSGTGTVRVSPTCTVPPGTSSSSVPTTEASSSPSSPTSPRTGFDLGGSGSNMRTPSCCVGPARCEWACYDTLKMPATTSPALPGRAAPSGLPLQVQVQVRGLPQRLRGLHRAPTCPIIGTWRDDIQIDQERSRSTRRRALDINAEVCGLCPTRCMEWDGTTLDIDNSNCVKCMHCINVMPKALKPGKERGATILIGSKAPIIGGALLSSVLVPFLEMKAPYEDLKELTEAIWDLWGEHGKNRERVGEFIQRVGLGNFLEEIGLDPVPRW